MKITLEEKVIDEFGIIEGTRQCKSLQHCNFRPKNGLKKGARRES